MPNKFSIEGRAFGAGFKDAQRTWLWEMTIVPPKLLKIDSERLLVHCRSAVVPGRSQNFSESPFGGMKQYFPNRPEFGGTFPVEIEETEDMFVRKFLNDWQEAIFGTSDKSVNQGYSSFNVVANGGQKKGLVAQQLELQMFKYDGDPTDYKFKFINGILQNVGEVSVAYDNDGLVRYTATFQYDYFQMEKR